MRSLTQSGNTIIIVNIKSGGNVMDVMKNILSRYIRLPSLRSLRIHREQTEFILHGVVVTS